MQVKTIIVDDEPLAIQELKELLKEHEAISLVDTACTFKDALNSIKQHAPDLLLLDINLGAKDGFELLNQLEDSPYVIFVTAYDSYAMKAIEVNALAYLLKPIMPDKLAEAINKAIVAINKEKNVTKLDKQRRIFLKDEKKCYLITLDDIYLIESEGNYSRVYFMDQRILIHRTLTYFEGVLPDEMFFRANRQVIFNLNYVENVSYDYKLEISLKTGQNIIISQRQAIRFKSLLGV